MPATPRQSLTAIERGFAVLPSAEPMMLFPQIREQLKDAPAFLRDSKAGINIRSYYRDEVTNASTGSDLERGLGGRRLGGLRDRPAVRPDLRRHGPLHLVPGLCAARP